MEIKYDKEELESVVSALRDVSGSDFWQQKYFYSKSSEEKKADDREKEGAAKKAKALLSAYDSEPTSERARDFVHYTLLEPNILFSLKNLRKMVWLTSQLEEVTEMRDRLSAIESILNNSGVPVKFKALKANPKDLCSYIKDNYKNYYELNGKLDGNDDSRMVFTDTFWAKWIPVELLSRGKVGYKEDSTLGYILDAEGKDTLVI